MSRSTKSQGYLMKCLGFVLLLGFISLFAIGGCSDNSSSTSSGEDLAALLGEQRQDAAEDIKAAFNVAHPFDGELNHIIIDGTNFGALTDEEKVVIRDVYEQGFIVIIYDVTEAQIEELYHIIDHRSKFDSGTTMSHLEEGNDGEIYDVITIEKIGRVHWSSIMNIGNLPAIETADGGFLPGTGLATEDIGFQFHALHMKEWIEQHKDRVQELASDGLLDGNATSVLTRFGLMDEFEDSLRTVTGSGPTGTLVDLASADLHTNFVKIGFSSSAVPGVKVASAAHVNTYQFTSKVWIITAVTPNGLYSFLFVNQDFFLASRNGFLINDEAHHAYSTAQQAWYLSNLTAVNTLAVGSTTLDLTDVLLLDNKPDTNQATVVQTTTSIDYNMSGTVGIDQDGANASISGGVSWGTSETYSKENVSINNISLSETLTGTDASWEYVPNAATPGGSKGLCDKLGLRGLADLAHTTFKPKQAFIYRISPKYVGETLKLKTKISLEIRNTYISWCNMAGCSCRKTDQNHHHDPWTFTHSIAIPEAPEGPPGDPTCSDGIDNDKDGDTDSADNQC